MRKCSEHEKTSSVAVDFDVATLLCSPFCSWHPFRHRFGAPYQAGILSAGSRAEMTDVDQMKKFIPFVTCEITFGQNVCEWMFGINVSNLNLRIKINSVKQPIQSNPVGS